MACAESRCPDAASHTVHGILVHAGQHSRCTGRASRPSARGPTKAGCTIIGEGRKGSVMPLWARPGASRVASLRAVRVSGPKLGNAIVLRGRPDGWPEKVTQA